jgi:hypothetical protein
MGPIFKQPMRRVRHDLMDNFNFLALAHWRKIVQIDIYYYFQSFFNEHEYKYAVDVMRNSIHMWPKVLPHVKKKSLYNQPKPYFFKKLL